MLYHNLPELIQLLKTNQIYTEKRLGQNFLFNTQIVEKILQAADLSPTDLVVEIGPGLGILTMELLKVAQKVLAIEKDAKLIPYLRKLFSGRENFSLLEQDVLRFSPPAEPYKVVANIPYYITSPIISHFLQTEQHRRPRSMILLTQLEVARKICAREGDHSVISLQTQLYAQPKLIAQVAAHNFYPAPKVKSAILKLETLDRPRLDKEKEFLAVIRQVFTHKRKTLVNGLTGLNNLSKTEIISRLGKSGLKTTIRPQELSFADWARLLDNL